MTGGSEGQTDRTWRDEREDLPARRSAYYLSMAGQPCECLIRRLALVGLPTREIVRLTGTPSRTVTRTLQRLGVKREDHDGVGLLSPKKRHRRRLREMLSKYFALDGVNLDSLHQLAKRNDIPLGKLLCLIREHVSPARWAIRTCLACSRPALTASPADRYCSTCRKKIKKVRRGFDESAPG